MDPLDQEPKSPGDFVRISSSNDGRRWYPRKFRSTCIPKAEIGAYCRRCLRLIGAFSSSLLKIFFLIVSVITAWLGPWMRRETGYAMIPLLRGSVRTLRGGARHYLGRSPALRYSGRLDATGDVAAALALLTTVPVRSLGRLDVTQERT